GGELAAALERRSDAFTLAYAVTGGGDDLLEDHVPEERTDDVERGEELDAAREQRREGAREPCDCDFADEFAEHRRVQQPAIGQLAPRRRRAPATERPHRAPDEQHDE